MVNLNIELPDNFLDEEKRCDYVISSDMKKVWAVELDLLVEFDRVCKKHGIKYFASGGTMLGAVRHKGFIPWDDDIDLMMMRDDYNQLCKIASKEFKHPYFFQTEYTDEGSLRGHAQLRNSMTTGILNGELIYKFRFNQGIFIDIFPLDSVIDDETKYNIQKKRAKKFRSIYTKLSALTTRYSSNSEEKGIKKITKNILHILFSKFICKYFNPQKYYRLFEDECSKYNTVNTKMISTLSFQFENRQHFKYRSDYEEIIEVPFEFLTIPIARNYKHALKKRYGNYEEYVVGNSCHGNVIFDTEKPYTEYIK